MFYEFVNGPLHGEVKEITPDKIEGDTYTWWEVGDFPTVFSICPKLTTHTYFIIGNTMVYREPEEKN